MEKNILIIVIILFIIINCFSFRLFYSNKQNIKVIEKMGTPGNANIKTRVNTQIIEQINKIYKADIQAIKNLSNISKKLQKGKLVLPGNLSIKGKLVTIKNANIGPINTNMFILSGKNISNEINQLNSKISALQTRQTNWTNQHSNLLGSITNVKSRVNNLKSKFPDNNTLVLGPNKIFSNNKGFQFANNSKGAYANNTISCYANPFRASYIPFTMFGHRLFAPIKKHNKTTIVSNNDLWP